MPPHAKHRSTGWAAPRPAEVGEGAAGRKGRKSSGATDISTVAAAAHTAGGGSNAAPIDEPQSLAMEGLMPSAQRGSPRNAKSRRQPPVDDSHAASADAASRGIRSIADAISEVDIAPTHTTRDRSA